MINCIVLDVINCDTALVFIFYFSKIYIEYINSVKISVHDSESLFLCLKAIKY